MKIEIEIGFRRGQCLLARRLGCSVTAELLYSLGLAPTSDMQSELHDEICQISLGANTAASLY